jgi:hypothetical protein
MLAAAPSVAQGQDGIFVDSTVIESIDAQTLRDVIERLEADATALDEEAETLRVAFPDGSIAVIQRTACGRGGCRGLLLTSLFTKPADMPAERAEQVAQRFASSYYPVSLIVNERGEHLMKAYVLFDGGVTRANLAYNLALFGLSIARYRETLYAAGGEAPR